VLDLTDGEKQAPREAAQQAPSKPLITGEVSMTSSDRIRSQPMTEAEVKEVIAAEVRKPMLEL
jgi:hypothetical protein